MKNYYLCQWYIIFYFKKIQNASECMISYFKYSKNVTLCNFRKCYMKWSIDLQLNSNWLSIVNYNLQLDFLENCDSNNYNNNIIINRFNYSLPEKKNLKHSNFLVTKQTLYLHFLQRYLKDRRQLHNIHMLVNGNEHFIKEVLEIVPLYPVHNEPFKGRDYNIVLVFNWNDHI